MLSFAPKDIQEIFRKHREGLVDLATVITGNSSQAEDIVQEAFLQFAKQSETQTIDAPYPYLVGIVRRLSVGVIRREVREQKVFDRSVGDDKIMGVQSKEESPEAIITRKDQYRAFLAAVAELPAPSRRAVLMHYIEGMTVKQIANRLGVSNGQAHNLISDGAVHCQEKLQKKASDND